MDPMEAFRCWDMRMAALLATQVAAPLDAAAQPPRGGLQEMFQDYGVRYQTVGKIGELGFTVSTLVAMKEEEVEDMLAALCHVFRWELLVGERYGIKAAIRTERRRRQLDGFFPPEEEEQRRRRQFPCSDAAAMDALSQEGLSEERQLEIVSSAGEPCETQKKKKTMVTKKKKKKKKKQKKLPRDDDEEEENEEEDEEEEEEREEEEEEEKGFSERQREHPFIVTEPGEVARGKKNGLDYLFHLYDLCREFLLQVQAMARDRGHKCPTKVTNQVFRFAKEAGASYINKPKMRHYVHCYALHCLDEEASNLLRRVFKEKGENVGAWRQACYQPLVAMAGRRHGWDVDAMFNSQPKLAIWYVPTKLRQLCHLARSGAVSAAPPANCLSGGVAYIF